MGIVYEGRDPNLDRRVAIKTVKVQEMPAGEAADYEARFRTEARSAARLAHPHIVTVHDWDRDGNIAFLVMEFVQGHDLKHDLDRGPGLDLGSATAVIEDLLSALAYAHERGVVHRDVKPANLLVDASGRVKLTDFGVARIQDSGDLTRTQGSMIGTLKYMAPEQVQGLKVDARADLFSAGVVLYQLLTNRRPFDADNDFSIIQQIISSEPPRPSQLNTGLGEAMDAVVARALAKDRDQRFQSADEFAQALRDAMQAQTDRALRPPPPERRTPAEGAQREEDSSPSTPASAPMSSPGLRSSITQELELVYWKDVRESADPEELESFLVRFPQGIYADLARKRIARLRDASSGTDTTILTGMAGAGAGASAGEEPVAGSPRSADAPGSAAGGLAAAAEGGAVAPGNPAQDTWPAGAPLTGRPGDDAPASARAAQGLPGATSAADPSQPQAAASASGAAARPARRRGPVLALAGLLLAVGTAAWVWRAPLSPAPSASADAAAPAAHSAASQPPVTKELTAESRSPAGAVAASSAPAVAVAGGGASHAGAAPSAASPSHNASRPATHKTRETAVASRSEPLPQPQASGTAPAPVANVAAAPSQPAREAARPANWSAVDACRDRVFLMRELCLVDACGKPGTQAHPLCVQHREEVRVREASRRVDH